MLNVKRMSCVVKDIMLVEDERFFSTPQSTVERRKVKKFLPIY